VKTRESLYEGKIKQRGRGSKVFAGAAEVVQVSYPYRKEGINGEAMAPPCRPLKASGGGPVAYVFKGLSEGTSES
jgi:hypothetical protein